MTHYKHERNPGMKLDMGWVNGVQVNRPAVLLRAATHKDRRCVKKQAQLGWLAKCVTLIDLTTLDGGDAASNVKRLCAKAANPVDPGNLKALGLENKNIKCGAVCVYPACVKDAVAALKGTGIPVASVAAGFPTGLTPMPQRLAEIEQAVKDGAQEIDIVITRSYVSSGEWEKLYDEIVAFRKACGAAHLKTIIATGDLPTFRDVYKASLVCMMAGADFVKTSTGKEKVNATLAVGLVMIRSVRDYHEKTGYKVGFKPAGGISSAKDATCWLSLMLEELGHDWCQPDLFRMGASSLLGDIERQIEHGVKGHYAGAHYIPAS
jgi:deoxyribose-phosphate aldolase